MPAVTSAAEVAALGAGKPGAAVVLDFGAAWCKNCAKLAPHCEALAVKMPGVVFASVGDWTLQPNAPSLPPCAPRLPPCAQLTN